MRTVNIHEAKTHLSRLIEDAANGESFVIAKSGKPMVKVTAIHPPTPKSRIGFLDGQFTIPDDFDTLHREEIIRLFEGNE
jgi:prevent-host-death family protein